MRQMVFNHASARTSKQNRHDVSGWLKGIAVGMSQLVRGGVVQKSLRLNQQLYAIQCSEHFTLWDALNALGKAGYREERRFLLGLTAHAPLLDSIDEEVKDRFLSTESKHLPGSDDEPTILCAIADWIAVSFPSSPTWDSDNLVVQFRQLLCDDTMVDHSETVDHLSRTHHAASILDRHLARLQLGCDNPRLLWKNRRQVFPYLLFGPEVEHNLISCARSLGTIVRKLIALNESSREWREQGGPAPMWKIYVTPESKSSMQDPEFVRTRTFKSCNGTSMVFERHARFGSVRIHLRFDSASRDVEIGYIGPHLPV